MMDIEDLLDFTPPEIKDVAEEVINGLMPDKSKKIYEQRYKYFKDWCKNKRIQNTTENVMIAFFNEQSKTFKSSTLWSMYSMLKTMLNLRENIEISNFFKLKTLLKKTNAKYKAKKSDVFSRDDINKFLIEAPDDKFLMMKVSYNFISL